MARMGTYLPVLRPVSPPLARRVRRDVAMRVVRLDGLSAANEGSVTHECQHEYVLVYRCAQCGHVGLPDPTFCPECGWAGSHAASCSRPAVPTTEPTTALRFSRIDDRCVCGAEFHAEGMPSWTARMHKDWLDAHIRCRFNAAVSLGAVS